MREKIYSARQVLAAAILGGPVGGLYALWRNIGAKDSLALLLICVLLGWLPVLAYLLVFPYMPLWASLGFLPVFCAAAYLAASRNGTEKAVVQAGKKYEYYQSRDVAIMSVSMLVATLVAEVLWVRVLADFV